MNESWQRYWREMFRYTRYLAAGVLISFFPFLLNLENFQRGEGVLRGFLWSMAFGLIVGVCVWSLFAVVFACLTLIHIKTGWPWRVPVYLYFVIAGLGAAIGIRLSLGLRGNPVRGYDFFGAMVVSGIIGLVFLLHFFYRQAKEESLAHRAAAAEARYSALEHQMRPHFLFNALNSLAELIESKHDSAAEMTHKLSDLYRLILASSNRKTSPLEEEAEICRRYLELEQLRFGQRLRFSINIPDSAEIFIPSLMMQTLVENAVKHGIAKSVDGGEVAIRVSKAENGLYKLSVSNTGQPFDAGANSGTGFANTRSRLDLLYGPRHHFAIDSSAERTTASFYFSGERID
ncbi:MAG: histidine kinase [Acidobacteriota bacterium]